MLQRCFHRATFVGVRLFTLLLLVAGSLWAQTGPATPNEDFDKPSKKSVVDFGLSPYNPPSQHIRKKLTCYYYSTFTVKEYDEGQEGAEWLSVVPSAHAACTRTHRKDERVYVYPEWSGYFWGAKGGVVLFGAPDGENGGVPFAAFDVRTGRKLFSDSSILEYYQQKLHIENAFRISSVADQVPRLAYFRVVAAGCDLRTAKADCWKRVRAKFGIAQTKTPVCIGYEKVEGNVESSLAYPVSVLLKDSPQLKAAIGPVFCWPVD